MIISKQERLLRWSLARPPGMYRGVNVVDIGAGLRPMEWYRPLRHVCVEPFEPYCKELRKRGYEVWQQTAIQYLSGHTFDFDCDVIFLLDVIEHMDKETARRVLRLAMARARRQVVVFTPLGFLQQTHDAWGLGGEYWQTHRSGWVPREFPGWRTHQIKVQRGTAWGYAFFALWDARSLG